MLGFPKRRYEVTHNNLRKHDEHLAPLLKGVVKDYWLSTLYAYSYIAEFITPKPSYSQSVAIYYSVFPLHVIKPLLNCARWILQ